MLTFNSYKSPTRIPADVENFTLSKTRLNLNDVVYSDEQTLCVRIKEKMVRFATTFLDTFETDTVDEESCAYRCLRYMGQERSGQSDGRKAASVAKDVSSVCAVDTLSTGTEMRFGS
jgi:hypothetical protein